METKCMQQHEGLHFSWKDIVKYCRRQCQQSSTIPSAITRPHMNQWNPGWPCSWIWLCFLVSGVYCRVLPLPFLQLNPNSQILIGQTGQAIRCLWVPTSNACNVIFCHHHLLQPLWFYHCLQTRSIDPFIQVSTATNWMDSQAVSTRAHHTNVYHANALVWYTSWFGHLTGQLHRHKHRAVRYDDVYFPIKKNVFISYYVVLFLFFRS